MAKTAAASSGSSSRSSGGTRRKSSSSSGSNGNGKTTAKSGLEVEGSKSTAKRQSGRPHARLEQRLGLHVRSARRARAAGRLEPELARLSEMLKGAVAKRVSGDNPSPVHAALAAVVAGAAAAVVTYKLLRS